MPLHPIDSGVATGKGSVLHAITTGLRSSSFFGGGDASLLAGETDGLAIDFTATSDFALSTWAMQAVQERNSSVDTLQSPHVFFTQSGTSPKYVKDSSTTIGWSPHNLIIQSQEGGDAAWTTSNLSWSSDAIAAPDGTTTADLMTADNGGDAVSVQMRNTTAVTIIPDVNYTLSAYVKSSTAQYFWMSIASAGTAGHWISAIYDVTGVSVTDTDVGGTSGTIVSTSITDVGSGWYRIALTGSVSTITDGRFRMGLIDAATNTPDTGGTRSMAAVGTQAGYWWGMQITRGITANAYIATTTAAKIGVPISYGEGLMVEPAATNLCTESQTLNAAAWTNGQTSETANAVVAPDGSQTAETLTADGTTNTHSITAANASYTSGTTYTASIYAKAGTASWIQLILSNTSFVDNQVFANYNISDGSIGATIGSSCTATNTSIGNGWYRCTITATADATAASAAISIHIVTSGTEARSPSNAISTTVHLWGAQTEAGAVATSYIPTVAATVTRAADNVNAATSTFGFSTTEGTVYFDGTAAPAVPANQFGWQFDDGTANEKIRFYRDTSNNPTASIIDGGAEQIGPLDAGTITASARTQVTVAWKANLVAASIGGAASVDDTSATLPTVTTLRLGADINVTHWNAPIRRFVYVPRQIEEDGQTVETWRYVA